MLQFHTSALLHLAIGTIIAHRCEIFYHLSAFRLFLALYLSDTVPDTRGLPQVGAAPAARGNVSGWGFFTTYEMRPNLGRILMQLFNCQAA